MLALTLTLLACGPKAPADTAAPTVEDTQLTADGDDTGAPGDDTAPGDTSGTDDTSDDTGTSGPDDSGTPGTDDTGPPPTLFALEGDCATPASLPDDPITLAHQLTTGQGGEDPGLFMEALDAYIDWDGELAYIAGQGGFMTFDLSAGKPESLDSYQGPHQRYYKVEPLADGVFALAHRDIGVHLLSASNPRDITLVHELNTRNASAVASAGDYLYIGTVDGQLLTYDVSDPSSPTSVDTLTGLGTVWDLARDGDWLYAADNSIGLVAIDISDPGAPALGAAAPTESAAQGVDVDGGYAYVATGSAGIQIFDLSDPEVPAPLTSVAFGASVINVSADDGLVWGVNHEDVVVIDVSDPANPVTIGAEETEEWSMCVAAQGDRALVGDWGNLDIYEVDRAVRSPEADPSRSELYFYTETDGAELTLANRGADTLHLVGGSVSDSRLGIRVDATSIAPGEEARVVIDFEDDGEDITALVCLATDDPDEPLQQVAVASSSFGGESIAVGESAIDFTLVDTDGVTHRLSDNIGRPIVLVYFATW